MNRSTESIHQLSQRQKTILTKSNQSHEKALNFRQAEKERQVHFVNSKFIDSIYSNDKKRTKLFEKEMDTSRNELLKAKCSLLKSSAQLMNSRITVIKKDNSFISKKLNEVRSTISLKDFHKEYDRHAERSSMLSKFKIDARSFKFIPKNEILLEKILKNNRTLVSTDRSRVSENIEKSGFITERLPQNNFSTKAKQSLIKLSLPNSLNNKTSLTNSLNKNTLLNNSSKKIMPSFNSSVKKLEFKNLKLEQLNFSQKKYQPKTSTLMRMSNPEESSSAVGRMKVKFNQF